MSGSGKLGLRECGSFLVVVAVVVVVFSLFSTYNPPHPIAGSESSVGGTAVGSDALYNYETTRYQSSAKVIEEVTVERTIAIGISSSTDSMDFGEIPSGANYAKREINMVNLEGTPVRVRLGAEGGISPHVQFERNDFVLGGNTNATVGVFFVAQGADIGEYSGEITVQIKRPKYAALPLLG